MFSTSAEQSMFPTSSEPGLFSSNTPAATISVFGVTEAQHNGSPGWASHGWGGRASPAVSTQVASTPPIWTPQWGTTDANNSNTGWPDSNQKQLGAPASSHSTNPFGTSPSNPPANQFYSSDNNNDLFAAAPKPTHLEPRHPTHQPISSTPQTTTTTCLLRLPNQPIWNLAIQPTSQSVLLLRQQQRPVCCGSQTIHLGKARADGLWRKPLDWSFGIHSEYDSCTKSK